MMKASSERNYDSNSRTVDATTKCSFRGNLLTKKVEVSCSLCELCGSLRLCANRASKSENSGFNGAFRAKTQRSAKLAKANGLTVLPCRSPFLFPQKFARQNISRLPLYAWTTSSILRPVVQRIQKDCIVLD